MEKIIESLSPNESKIIPHLKESITEICKKTSLDKVSVMRALEYLQNKQIIKLDITKTKIIDLAVNGILYKRKGLPERRLLNALNEKRILTFEEAQKVSEISNEEFKASLGALKRKALVEINNGKIIFNSTKEEIAKKSLEELFLEKLPLEYDKILPEQKLAFLNLQNRKQIVEIVEKKETKVEVLALGNELIKKGIKPLDLIEQITPNLLKSEKNWKGKKFRRYDVSSPVPKIYGGKRHFVNQSIDYARKVWSEMGFKEMTANMLISSFWNFDALFTAQDHPAREMQDTFFVNKTSSLPDKKIVEAVKNSHEKGVLGSKGWQYKWDEEMSKKMVLRTHTTSISSQKFAKLEEKDLPAKFFAIGKCFRNETVDWSHGFEFNQSEGIVVDPNANFRHLLGYLKQFYKKMGIEKIRFRPSYFPYTEPSVEIDTWNEEKKCWLEIGGAGMIRPEVIVPLLGKNIPVLAWGPGFDRTLMEYYGIKDLREMYKNNLDLLRKMKYWIK